LATGVRETKKIRRREVIFTTATRILREQGYEKTTMDGIAQEAGVAVGTLYNYFASKSELILALVVEADERCIAACKEVIAAPPENPVEALAAIGILQSRYSIEALDKHAWRYVLAAQASTQDAVFARQYAWTTARLRELFVETLAALKARGDLTSDVDPAELGYYLKAMKHMLFDYFIADDQMGFAQHAQEIRRGLELAMKGHLTEHK
jgi:AcrR family transcriptional regulator